MVESKDPEDRIERSVTLTHPDCSVSFRVEPLGPPQITMSGDIDDGSFDLVEAKILLALLHAAIEEAEKM